MGKKPEIAARCGAVALCVLALTLSAGVAQAHGGIPLPTAIRALAARGAQSPAEQALLEATAQRYRIPGFGPSHGVVKCGFGAVYCVRQYWNSYTPEERAFIQQALLSRPTTQTSIISPSGKFRIYYDTSGFDATAPEYIAAVATICDSVYDFEIGALGYAPPPTYGNKDGDYTYSLFVTDLYDRGLYGFTQPDTDNQTDPGDVIHPHYSAWFNIDNNYSAEKTGYSTHGLDGARVTIAHEFFHVVQIGDYGIWQTPFADNCDGSGDIPNRWFFEMSSVWMETAAYPGIPDYVQYIPWLFQNITDNLQFGITPCGDLGYSLALFFHYADRLYVNDHTIVRSIWDQTNGAPPLQAIDNAFRARSGSLGEVWCEFCKSLLFTDSRANDTLNYYSYSDARQYAPVAFRLRLSAVPPLIADSIHLLTSAYYVFALNDAAHDSLYAVVTNIDTTAGFQRSLAAQPFMLSIGQSYPFPIPGTNLSFQFAPDLTNWCVTLTKANIDESGAQPPYPDPFIADGTSQIFFPIQAEGVPKKVELKIFTESGTLAYGNSSLAPQVRNGKLGVGWDGKQSGGGEAASGVYLYAITVNGSVSVGKIALVHK